MMKFQLHKTKNVHRLFVCMLSLLVLFGCKDDLYLGFEQGQLWSGDGRSVNVSLSYAAPQVEKYKNTRATMDEAAERFVNDLFVALYPINDANHNGIVDPGEVGNVAFQRYYNYDNIDQLEVNAGDGKHYNRGRVSVEGIPTGTYYVLGFANIESGAHESFLEDLRAATTWADMQNIQVKLKQDPGQVINLDRSRLCMSGYYHTPDCTEPSDDKPHPVIINQSGELNGYIHLRRLDAKIKFIIQNEIPNCTRFDLIGWKMCNVPSSASLIEQTTDAATTYQSTDFRQYWTYMPKKNNSEFDHYDISFYMMENRKAALQPSGEPAITTYKQREKEYKLSSGFNDRDADGNRVYNYMYADADAAYLVFEANMEQTMEEGGVQFPRTAEMKYVVHLGYCDPQGGTEAQRAGDFNTRRNSDYTYLIRILGADDIRVEAVRTSMDEYMNGVEGMVVDMKGGQVEQLDTHYGVFNVTLTRREIREMLVQITSVLGEQLTTVTSSQTVMTNLSDYVAHPENYAPFINYLSEDYQGVRLAPLGVRDVNTELVSYSETYDYDWESGSCPTTSTLLPPHGEKKQMKDTNHNIPLFDFIGLKTTYGSPYSASNPYGYVDETQSTDAGHLDEPLNFTMFINEYYYYYDNGMIPKTRTLNADGTINTASEDLQEVKMWQQISNKRKHRIYRLFADTETSSDNDSHYLVGKLHVEQRAPQTYYSDKVNVAVALEHINEHHWKLIEAARGSGDHGWTRTYNTLNNQGWGNQALKLGEGYPAFSTKNDGTGNSNYHARFGTSTSAVNHGDKWTNRTGYFPAVTPDTRKYNILDAALSRNRDLDRNSQVSDKEIRWYTPYVEQYVDFAVGQGALETPLFSRADAAPALIGNEQVYENRRFHYLSQDNQYMWSEEGTSTGGGTYGWEIRCCRIMGTEDYANNLHLATPYEYNSETRLFDTKRYAENGIHRGYVLSEAMLPHDNLNLQSNALPYYFKMAEEDSPIRDVIPSSGPNASTQQEVLWNRMISDEYCRNYSEDPDGKDLGKWHVPNQMELALMFYGANLRPNGGYQYLSSTYWWRNSEDLPFKEGFVQNQSNNWRHFMGANGNNLRMLHTGHSGGLPSTLGVRCVIDTDKNGNPAGTPEYNSPISFQAGVLTAHKTSGDQFNISVDATLNGALVSDVKVYVDNNLATTTGGLGSPSSTITISSTAPTATVKWVITTNDSKVLNFSRSYAIVKAKLLTWSDISSMSELSSKLILWSNPSNTKPVFVSHNGTSASLPSYGFTNAATLAAAANKCALNVNHHFILTKVSGGYTLTSKNGGFSPNRNGGNVSWSTSPDVFTLENYTGGSYGAIVDWQAASSIRIVKDGAWINVNGPVYNTGAGDWVKMYFYEVIGKND